MRPDTRLSGVLHVLLHMAEEQGPVTSEVLAQAMHTNPVVIRRTLSGLREHGYVRSEKGHGGGWSLAGPALVDLGDPAGVRFVRVIVLVVCSSERQWGFPHRSGPAPWRRQEGVRA